MRSKVILDYFKKQNYLIKVVTFGQALPYLQKYFDCFEITGWELVYKNNKVSYLATGFKDAKKFPGLVKSFNSVRKLIDDFSPDFIFSDFEPLVSILAKIKKLPCVSVGNHQFITNCRIKFPKKYLKDYLTVKMITEAWTPYADYYLVTTFVAEKIKNKKTILVPPILQDEVLDLQPQIYDYVMVYLTSEFEKIIPILNKINENFIVYGLNRNEKIGNIELKEFSRHGFLNDLKNCKAVIANAGFTFIGEALYLKKPFLAIPIAKQFEQIINGVYLEKLGYGRYCMRVDREEILKFLVNLNKYRNELELYEVGDNQKLYQTIDLVIEKLIKKDKNS